MYYRQNRSNLPNFMQTNSHADSGKPYGYARASSRAKYSNIVPANIVEFANALENRADGAKRVESFGKPVSA